MASRKTSPPKPAKPVTKPRPAKAIVKDLRTGISDLTAIDPEHPWAKLLKDAIVAIQEQQKILDAAIAVAHEHQAASLNAASQLATFTKDSRDGVSQVRGELEQIRTHLARLIDAGIRERSRDDRIETQLAGINERLKERSKVERVIYHGKMVTAEELSKQADAMERANGEEIATLRGEVDRLRSEFEAARATAAVLESMAVDPRDRCPMPPPRKSWRTTAAERAKDEQIVALHNELDATRRANGAEISSLLGEVERLKVEIDVARVTAAETLLDPLDRPFVR